ARARAQVLAGGRAKAGGTRPAETLEAARAGAAQTLGMDIHGYRVKQVYLEERLHIVKELYLGLTIDRSAREPLLMATAMGGIDVEEVPREDLLMEHIPAMLGLQPYVIRSLLRGLALDKDIGEQVAAVVRHAYDLFRKEDAELVEINPLVVTDEGRVVAGDAKLVVDDNAEYRHPEYAGLNQALDEMHATIPVVARIKGVNEAAAKEILRSIGSQAAETIEEAAELAVKLTSGGP